MPRIFLVNAFRDERDMYAEFLTARGHDVTVFVTPEKGLEVGSPGTELEFAL